MKKQKSTLLQDAAWGQETPWSCQSTHGAPSRAWNTSSQREICRLVDLCSWGFSKSFKATAVQQLHCCLWQVWKLQTCTWLFSFSPSLSFSLLLSLSLFLSPPLTSTQFVESSFWRCLATKHVDPKGTTSARKSVHKKNPSDQINRSKRNKEQTNTSSIQCWSSLSKFKDQPGHQETWPKVLPLFAGLFFGAIAGFWNSSHTICYLLERSCERMGLGLPNPTSVFGAVQHHKWLKATEPNKHYEYYEHQTWKLVHARAWHVKWPKVSQECKLF